MPTVANPLTSAWHQHLKPCLFAAVISGLTLAVRLSLAPWLGDRPLIVLFILPVIISAYIGGISAGLVATALCAGSVYFLFLSQVHILFFEGSTDLWQWVLLIVNGVLISIVIEALHRSRRQVELTGDLHRVTLASIGDAVITTDESGRVTFLNAEAENLTEWPNDQALGQPLARVFHIINEKTGQAVDDPVLKVLRTGLVVGLANHTLLLGQNGRRTAIDDSGAPIKNRQGAIIGAVLVFRDCTAKRKAEDALRESQALYHSLVDQMPAGLYLKDAGGRYSFVNLFFHQLHGLPLGEFIGKLPREVSHISPLVRTLGTEHHELIMRTGQTVESLDEYHHPDGRKLFFRVIRTPVFDCHGNVAGSQGLFFDVTQRMHEEVELARSLSLLRATIEATSEGVLVVDTHDRVTVFNHRLLVLFNIPPELVAKGDDAPLLKFVTAQQAEPEEFLRRVREIYAHPELDTLELLHLKDGRALERNSHPQRLDGKIIGRVWIFRDITDKHTAEEKFLREQARFKLIFDTVPVGIAFDTTRPDGSFTRKNNGAQLRNCGLTHPQHDDPGINERIPHPHDYRRQQQFMAEVQAGRRKQFAMEKRYLLAGGRVVWVNFSYQREAYPDGAIEELITVVDITASKAAEQQSQQLAVIVESTEDAIIGINLEGVVTSWNHGAENIFGFSAAEMIGQPVLQMCPPELVAERAHLTARLREGEGIKHFQTDRLRKDGERIHISATISPLRDGAGNMVGASAIIRDVTRQQLLEEQLRQSQKMEAIGQLAGGVAHDFNNILAVIQMQIELSKMDGNLSPEQAGCLDEIQTAANRGANLTRQLLLFSRRQRPQPRELELSDSINGMTHMLRRVLGEHIQIQFKYVPGPLLIHADAVMIDQVLMNLTLNSRDAMPNGGQLIIETAAVELDEPAAAQTPQARPGSFVRLTVADTGCGIPSEILPRIFEPFFTTKDVGKGTGLGLATVFSIVEQHHGWINVASQPGRGTQFNLYFPRLIKAVEATAKPAAEPAGVTGGSETLLLVEDDDALRDSVHRCLTQLGYRLLEASTGAAALQIWEQHRQEINLLLTDMVMPGGMTGRELAEHLRRENPNLKVLYVSGYSAELSSQEFPADSITFLAKPFPAHELARAIRACLDQPARGKT